MMSTLLNLVLLSPAAGAAALLLIPRRSPDAIRGTALGVSVVALVASLPLIWAFDQTADSMQFEVNVPWLSEPAIHFHLAVDGISLFLVPLVPLLAIVSVVTSWRSASGLLKEYHFLLLILETGAIGAFLSLDLLLFYLFWAGTLLAICFLPGGRPKVLVCAAASSAFLLAAVLWLQARLGTTDYEIIRGMLAKSPASLSTQEQTWLFLAFLAAFALQAAFAFLYVGPADRHGGLPYGFPILLAGILPAMGVYGLIRFCLPFFPEVAQTVSPWLLSFAMLGIVYGSLAALAQSDLNRLIPHMVLAQLGFVLLGIFSLNTVALQGALYQLLNLSLSTSALLVIAGVIYNHCGNTDFAGLSGLSTQAPVLAFFLFVSILSGLGVPPLNTFVGDVIILRGVFQERSFYAILAVAGLVASSGYAYSMYRTIYIGESLLPRTDLRDVNRAERAIPNVLLGTMLLMVLGAPAVLHRMDRATAAVLDRMDRREIRVEQRDHPPLIPDFADR
jgi:NADH-quinone oxidoreductase subunit M